MKIGWFSTGRDKAARDLLSTVVKKIREKEIPKTRISFVFSNREEGENEESDKFFALVRKYGFPLITFSSAKFKPDLQKENLPAFAKASTFAKATADKSAGREKWREEYDSQVIKLLERYRVDLIVLAGYMLIVSPLLCEKYKMINLHPAKPAGPKGTWQEVIWQLIRNREKESGVMMHLVTPELDAGPAISYCTYPIVGKKFNRLWQKLNCKLQITNLEEIIKKEGENEPLFKKIREEGLKREFPLIVYTIKNLANGKIKTKNNRIFVGNQYYPNGYCLNKEIKIT